MNNDDITSGYTVEIPDSNMAPATEKFDNIRELYVSRSGHTRLFTATRYGKRYVLKCLKEDFRYIPVYQQALSKEFEIGLQMDHANICRTIGFEEVENMGKAIVLEYIDGDTLEKLLADNAITLHSARSIARQTADALTYIHTHQTVHRDIKPSNIMVTRNGGNVKVIDFSLSDSDTFDILKIPAGTSGYIAPEQRLPGAKADIRSDIYSFGKVMEDMVSKTGDRKMAAVAKACTMRDITRRPDSIAMAFHIQEAEKGIRIATVLLTIISLLLSVYIATTLYQRANTTQDASDINGITTDDNHAVDIELWK